MKYKIYAGLNGGFGGATYQKTEGYSSMDEALEDAGTYSLRFLCTEIENRCFTGTIIGIYAADHTIIQRKTSEQDKKQNLQYDIKKQETLKTQRSSSSMTITNFEASVC